MHILVWSLSEWSLHFFPHCPSHQFALAPTPNAIFPRTEWMHKRCGHHAFIMANRYIHCDTLSRIVITATFARRFTSLGKYIIHKCIWMQSRIYYWQAIAKESRRAVGYLRWIQVIIVWVCVCGMHKICAFNSPTFKNTLCDRLPTDNALLSAMRRSTFGVKITYTEK